MAFIDPSVPIAVPTKVIHLIAELPSGMELFHVPDH
jgi:hypothetical protein